jgi:hypothetical protein
MKQIKLTKHEIQSGSNRQKHAEILILQLPKNHDGRNEWLLNYGIGEESVSRRKAKNLKFDRDTNACETIDNIQK